MTELEEQMYSIYEKTNTELINSIKRDRTNTMIVQVSLIVCITICFICYAIGSYKTTSRWLDYESQFEIVDISSDGGNANYIGENGDITNGSH